MTTKQTILVAAVAAIVAAVLTNVLWMLGVMG